jgi:hypothetical protein
MANKRSAFVARLHDEDAEEESNAFRRNGKNRGIDLKNYEEEMKVFDMENSDEEAAEDKPVKKREQKGVEKTAGDGNRAGHKLRGESSGMKVNRLVSEKAINEIYRNSILEA